MCKKGHDIRLVLAMYPMNTYNNVYIFVPRYNCLCRSKLKISENVGVINMLL